MNDLKQDNNAPEKLTASNPTWLGLIGMMILMVSSLLEVIFNLNWANLSGVYNWLLVISGIALMGLGPLGLWPSYMNWSNEWNNAKGGVVFRKKRYFVMTYSSIFFLGLILSISFSPQDNEVPDYSASAVQSESKPKKPALELTHDRFFEIIAIQGSAALKLQSLYETISPMPADQHQLNLKLIKWDQQNRAWFDKSYNFLESLERKTCGTLIAATLSILGNLEQLRTAMAFGFTRPEGVTVAECNVKEAAQFATEEAQTCSKKFN